VLFLSESGNIVPAPLRPDQPVEVAPNQVPMRDLPAGSRWRSAVFLAVSARSAGFAGVPLVEGGLNWVSLGILCVWMMIGGAAGSYAGGMRTTTILGLFLLWFVRRGLTIDEAIRRRLERRLLGLMLLMIALTLAAVMLLMIPAIQVARPWEKLLDGVA